MTEFDKLYLQQQPKIFAYLHTKLRNKTIAEDLLTEVYLKAHKYYKPQEVNSFVSWIHAIVRSVIIDYKRKASLRTQMTQEHIDHLNETPNPSSNLVNLINLLDFVSALPPTHRQTLELRAFYGESKACAEVLGIHESRFRGRLFHARRAAAERLAHYHV